MSWDGSTVHLPSTSEMYTNNKDDVMRIHTLSIIAILSCSAFATSASAAIPDCTAKGSTATVKASWYGKPFHGRTMANGKRYNMYDGSTVAHKSLRFGTKVRFTNPRSGRSIVTVVRDRGPYIAGRTFDLSMQGAKSLGVINSGVARVSVCIIR